MRSSGSWWGSKVHQSASYLFGRVSAAERSELARWTSPAQRRLFERMHRADQRHGLDVVAALRRRGVTDEEILLAGLFHDAGKGRSVGLAPRVVHALGHRYGAWIPWAAAFLPGLRRPLVRLGEHAEVSAILASAAGCSTRTVELIRHLERPRDPTAGELLRRADEAS